AVVTTRVGDLPEILGESLDTLETIRGWLVPPGNPVALAAALVEIAARPDEARARGRAARAWFLEEASQAVIASRLLSLIGRITQPHASIVAAI
ncbi:MAG: hypothetical protein DMF85_20535, partial [Acidobacteria bacterium]